jgi:predicted RNase H-like nuclease
MTDYIIGIDCATDPKKRGIAVATYAGNACHIESVTIGMRDDELVERTPQYLQPNNRVLLALDAPLGWPSKMGTTLAQHQAGQRLLIKPNDLFRRKTDHFIKKEYDLQSLDVGADRIARTAHSALQLLESLRQGCRHTIPLTMDQNFTGMMAIEVYPAATLKTCGLPFRIYKKKDDTQTRRSILTGVNKIITIPHDVQETSIRSADALDAVICVLAGLDFLQGKATRPETQSEQKAAEKEGWIWVRTM